MTKAKNHKKSWEKNFQCLKNKHARIYTLWIVSLFSTLYPFNHISKWILDYEWIQFCNLLLFQEDLLIHGDSVYDIIDKQDHASIQSELMRGLQGNGTSSSSGDGLPGENSCIPPSTEKRIFLCRMNVSRNARRQMRFGDQKVCIYKA